MMDKPKITPEMVKRPNKLSVKNQNAEKLAESYELEPKKIKA